MAVERMWDDGYDTDPVVQAQRYAIALHDYWRLGKLLLGLHLHETAK